jgi:hypothetical protein
MNQFAHSADVSTETVDVGAVVHFVSDLAARLIAMKGAAPQIDAPLASVTTTTNRFFPGKSGVGLPVPGHGYPCPGSNGIRGCRKK